MTKAPISLQDLRRSLYVKAKAEPQWRFWGLYVHVCKRKTLYEAYRMAKANDGASGIDGVTFEAIEERWSGGFSKADTGRTGHRHVSSHAGTEEGDTERRG
jgi:RNA-directed DNA polymerase